MTLTPISFVFMVAAFILGLGANRIWRQVRIRPGSDTAASSPLADNIRTIQRPDNASLPHDKEDLRWTFATNPLAMWIYDLQTLEILDVNDAAISQYGYSRDAFLKMRLTDLHPPKYEAPSPKPVDQATNIVESSSWRDGGQWRHVLHDGRIIDVHILAHPVEFLAARQISLPRKTSPRKYRRRPIYGHVKPGGAR